MDIIQQSVNMRWGVPTPPGGLRVVIAIPSIRDLFEAAQLDVHYIATHDPGVSSITDIGAELYMTIKAPVRGTSVVEPYWVTRGNAEDGTERKVALFVRNEEYGFYGGITVHQARGSWSSSELHDFEIDTVSCPSTGSPYPHFREKFAYITWPVRSWLVQCKGGVADIHRDRDIVSIPIGPHPVVAAPGTQLAYIWVYANGPAKGL